VYFLLGGLITEYVRPQPWGPPAVLLATCAIMRFRPPPTPLESANKKKTKTKTKAYPRDSNYAPSLVGPQAGC